jgi:16S rRNA (cytidine1402-2'-O)-methyltransferase
MGNLYLVATPIGNLEDISFRVIKTLFEVAIIACEDTRRTGLLLQSLRNSYQRQNPQIINDDKKPHMVSYYEQNELDRIPEIISFLKNGLDVALVSDAGTPAISDPGFKLVREAAREEVKVISIPGPSSVLTALVASGLPTDKFTFAGYPPRKPGHRKTFFQSIKKSQEYLKTTVILFEAPHKIVKTLSEMQEVFGDIEVVLARELTKIHEEFIRLKISECLEIYKKKDPKGEFVIIFNLHNNTEVS